MFIKEVIVALVIIAIFLAGATPNLLNMLRKTKEYQTMLMLEKAQTSFKEWYKENAGLLESSPDGTTLTFGTETFYLPNATDTLDKKYQKLNPLIVKVTGLIGTDSFCINANFPNLDFRENNTYSDTFGDCLLVFTTEQKTDTTGTIKYRDFYIVSAGENRIVDFDGTNAGDDLIKLVSGYEVEKELYDETVKKLQIIKDALENYFYGLYLNDSTRDTSIDHFLYRRTDNSPVSEQTILDNSCLITGEDPNTQDCLASLDQIARDVDGDGNPDTNTLLELLGLNLSDLEDAWGNSIYIDNASFNVRSPETGYSSPYSARIVSITPWGIKIEILARQKF